MVSPCTFDNTLMKEATLDLKYRSEDLLDQAELCAPPSSPAACPTPNFNSVSIPSCTAMPTPNCNTVPACGVPREGWSSPFAPCFSARVASSHQDEEEEPLCEENEKAAHLAYAMKLQQARKLSKERKRRRTRMMNAETKLRIERLKARAHHLEVMAMHHGRYRSSTPKKKASARPTTSTSQTDPYQMDSILQSLPRSSRIKASPETRQDNEKPHRKPRKSPGDFQLRTGIEEETRRKRAPAPDQNRSKLIYPKPTAREGSAAAPIHIEDIFVPPRGLTKHSYFDSLNCSGGATYPAHSIL